MKIAFIGLGHMGGPMASNLLKAGQDLTVFDLSSDAVQTLVSEGAESASSVKEAVQGVDVVITMLPEGKHVRSVYQGSEGIFENVSSKALLIECSTTDMTTSRLMHEEAELRGITLLDAPVSGGVGGAKAGTLTFMVGGSADGFDRAKPILENMGKNIIHCGDSGCGQAAKICNNMVLGATMIATSEAFNLAGKLGLSVEKFFEVASQSSAQSWSMTSYCPAPGPVPTSPANRNYEAGFTAAMMLKDLKLAVDAAQTSHSSCPMGAEAMSLYSLFCANGGGAKDFSGIISWISGKPS